MGIIGDVFGLNSIYERQVQNVDNNNFESWPESATYGYFGGGETPPSVPGFGNTIDRIDFSSETLSLPGNNLLTPRSLFAAVSNYNYGYFACGDTTPITIRCTIDRLDFSNETISRPNTSFPAGVKESIAAVSSSDYGYFGGGSTPGPTIVATVRRLDFSNETTSEPGNDLTQARQGLAAVSSSNYGYFGGGETPTNVCTIDRLDFSNETTSAPGNDLSQRRTGLAAVSNSNYGYFGGGFIPPTVSTIDRLDFSTETVEVPTGYYLPQDRSRLAVVSNNSYGYFGGGLVPGVAPNEVCTIDRLDFSNETTSAPGNGITQARARLAAVSGGQSQRPKGSRTYGYFGGGSPGPVDTITRVDFSNETLSLPGNNLSQAREGLAAVSSSSYGYFGGGGPGPTPSFCTIDRLDFSNETVSEIVNNLTQNRLGLRAFSSSFYGYFGGGSLIAGSNTDSYSTIDRLDFSNETLVSPGTYQLSEEKNSLAAVSSSSHGYFVGGSLDPGSVCTIERLDFSNETMSNSATGIPVPKVGLTEVSTNLYGYFGGGFGPGFTTQTCTIDRLDFSNDTIIGPATLPGDCVLSGRGYDMNTFFSSSYGYFSGGSSPPGGTLGSTINRLDFSTETVSPAGTDTGADRSNNAAVSN